jgi:hypothetical protein
MSSGASVPSVALGRARRGDYRILRDDWVADKDQRNPAHNPRVLPSYAPRGLKTTNRWNPATGAPPAAPFAVLLRYRPGVVCWTPLIFVSDPIVAGYCVSEPAGAAMAFSTTICGHGLTASQ